MNIETINELGRSLAMLKATIADLEIRARGISAALLKEMTADGLKSVDCPGGAKITVCNRKIWKYPASIKALEEELKAAKKEFESESPDYEISRYLSTKLRAPCNED